MCVYVKVYAYWVVYHILDYQEQWLQQPFILGSSGLSTNLWLCFYLCRSRVWCSLSELGVVLADFVSTPSKVVKWTQCDLFCYFIYFILFYFIFCVCLSMWKSGDKLWELILFFHHVVCGGTAQVVRLGRHLYPLSSIVSCSSNREPRVQETVDHLLLILRRPPQSAEARGGLLI